MDATTPRRRREPLASTRILSQTPNDRASTDDCTGHSGTWGDDRRVAGMNASVRTAEEFFADSPVGRAVLRWVRDRLEEAGGCELRVSKSQVGFRRRRGFAFLWRPEMYVSSDVPVVLTIGLPERIRSPRWKEVVQTDPHTFVHHLEVRDVAALDDELLAWLLRAYASAE